MSFVYLICDPTEETYKIGVSRKDPSDRIKKLQTGNSNEIHIQNKYETETPFKLESMLHRKFKEKLKHGEWYKLEPSDVFNFLDTCKKMQSIIDCLKENPYF